METLALWSFPRQWKALVGPWKALQTWTWSFLPRACRCLRKPIPYEVSGRNRHHQGLNGIHVNECCFLPPLHYETHKQCLKLEDTRYECSRVTMSLLLDVPTVTWLTEASFLFLFACLLSLLSLSPFIFFFLSSFPSLHLDYLKDMQNHCVEH